MLNTMFKNQFAVELQFRKKDIVWKFAHYQVG